MSASFRRLATVPFTTKRSPPVVDKKRGEPAPYLTADTLRCTPLDTADSQKARELAVRFRQNLQSPYDILQVFTDGQLDIKEGDLLVIGGKEYAIRTVDQWTWRGAMYLHLLVEDLKRD